MSDVIKTSRSFRFTNEPKDDLLDLPAWMGQRHATFEFIRTNAVSGDYLSTITPLRGQSATLSHDTTRIIKRQLHIGLARADVNVINPLSDRIQPYMVMPNGTRYPLGKYMFTDETLQQFTSGNTADAVLNDEMYLVDQVMIAGVNASASVQDTVGTLISGTGVRLVMEETAFTTANLSWSAGAQRGQAIEDLAIQGDYFSPWFGNDTYMHFIRAFDPAARVPDFDWDATNVVVRNTITHTTDLLNAPNRFLVISNAANDAAVTGVAVVPPNAPHSFENRGFYITAQSDTQASNVFQVQAMASNLALRKTIVETVQLSTVPDPRHDSYNVIVWDNAQWLELGWTMALVEGGAMQHTMRKTYSGTTAVGSVSVLGTVTGIS